MDEFDDETDDELDAEEKRHREINSRVERKFEAFLEDIAEDVIDAGTLKKVEKKILKELQKADIMPTSSAIEAFVKGFDFGMKSTFKLEGAVAQLMVALHRYVQVRKAKKPKVEIDITKTEPLPDESHGNA